MHRAHAAHAGNERRKLIWKKIEKRENLDPLEKNREIESMHNAIFYLVLLGPDFLVADVAIIYGLNGRFLEIAQHLWIYPFNLQKTFYHI